MGQDSFFGNTSFRRRNQTAQLQNAQARDSAGLASLARRVSVKRVVFVGTQVSPGNPHKKPDGMVVRTLWGEIAWQLGGKEAYKLVKEDDERATNPGNTLKELFKKYGPCLILIDEWVAYARQLHNRGLAGASRL